MDNWNGKIAVVTGASGGIGANVVKDLAATGMHVVGLARRKECIEEIEESNGKIYAVQCDITKPESIYEAFEWIKEKFGKINVLVNNAGRTTYGLLSDPETPDDDLLQTINLNISGVVVCTREAYKLMANHEEECYIININSTLGHVTPTVLLLKMNIYPATKHVVRNFTEHFRLELAAAGNKRIRVTNLSPGIVATDFASNAGYTHDDFAVTECLSAQDVSDAIQYLLGTPARINITELSIKFAGEKI